MRFPSKVDTWLVVVLVAAVCGAFGIMFARGITSGRHPWAALGIVIALVLLNGALFAWIFSTTEYVVSPGELVVRSGPIRIVVPIKSIRYIRASRSMLSAPALSMDRLEVGFGTYDSVVISPRDKRGFVDALLVQAPNIPVEGSLD